VLVRIVRPYTEQEKEKLIASLPSRWSTFESYVGRFTFVLVLLLMPLVVIDKYFPISANNQLLTLFTLALIALIIVRYTQKNYEGIRTRKQVLAAITNGRAEVFSVKTSRAVEREDPEDFGTAFYLEVQMAGEQKLLYLQGQYLDELAWEVTFPNTEFELIRRADTHELVEVRLNGQHFKPERTLPAFPKARWQSGNVPEDGELLDGRLDELTE